MDASHQSVRSDPASTRRLAGNCPLLTSSVNRGRRHRRGRRRSVHGYRGLRCAGADHNARRHYPPGHVKQRATCHRRRRRSSQIGRHGCGLWQDRRRQRHGRNAVPHRAGERGYGDAGQHGGGKRNRHIRHAREAALPSAHAEGVGNVRRNQYGDVQSSGWARSDVHHEDKHRHLYRRPFDADVQRKLRGHGYGLPIGDRIYWRIASATSLATGSFRLLTGDNNPTNSWTIRS
jgi:hypothetical protein